jgi:hypothetical protein
MNGGGERKKKATKPKKKTVTLERDELKNLLSDIYHRANDNYDNLSEKSRELME